MPVQDHYKILEVSRQCDSQAITASYRRLALLHHPDRNPAPDSTAKFQKVRFIFNLPLVQAIGSLGWMANGHRFKRPTRF
jgi:hypothetical protein